MFILMLLTGGYAPLIVIAHVAGAFALLLPFLRSPRVQSGGRFFWLLYRLIPRPGLLSAQPAKSLIVASSMISSTRVCALRLSCASLYFQYCFRYLAIKYIIG
jgi:hypothetical protein